MGRNLQLKNKNISRTRIHEKSIGGSFLRQPSIGETANDEASKFIDFFAEQTNLTKKSKTSFQFRTMFQNNNIAKWNQKIAQRLLRRGECFGSKAIGCEKKPIALFRKINRIASTDQPPPSNDSNGWRARDTLPHTYTTHMKTVHVACSKENRRDVNLGSTWRMDRHRSRTARERALARQNYIKKLFTNSKTKMKYNTQAILRNKGEIASRFRRRGNCSRTHAYFRLQKREIAEGKTGNTHECGTVPCMKPSISPIFSEKFQSGIESNNIQKRKSTPVHQFTHHTRPANNKPYEREVSVKSRSSKVLCAPEPSFFSIAVPA